MKRFLLALVFLVSLAGPAAAEYIVIFADQAANLCFLPAPGYARVYVFDYTAIASGTKFRIDATNAPGTTLIQFQSQFPYTGDINSLIHLTYGACFHGTFLIGTIDLVAACGVLGVEDVTLIDCQGNEITDGYGAPFGWPFYLCEPESNPCPPFATEQSTWGRVKALYR